MAVTSVGAPVNTHAAAGSVTGTWGAGQLRPAGRVLAALVSAASSTSITVDIATASGWASQVIEPDFTTIHVAVACFTKVAAGGDAAPVFTVTGGGTVAMDCMLFELQGADTSTLVDTSGVYHSNTGVAGTLAAMTATTGASVAAAGGFALSVFAQQAAAGNLTWADSGTGFFRTVLSGNGVSSVLQTYAGICPAPPPAATLNDAGAFSVNTSAYGAGLVIVFRAAPVAYPDAPEVYANNASGTVTSGGTTALAGGASESWTVTATGAFPVAVGGSSQFRVVDPAAPSEKMLAVTAPGGAGAGQAWTVIRGADGTTPTTHASGFSIVQVVTAGSLGNFSQVFNVRSAAYGAVGNGVADDTAAIQAAVMACINAGGGIVRIPAGDYKITSQVTVNVPPLVTVSIQGDGYLATVLLFYGASGDCIRFYGSTAYVYNVAVSWRCGISDLTIDGTNAGAGSTGLHAGDLGLFRTDLSIQHFNGAGSIGLNLDNAINWTEEADIRATLIDCTQHVVFQVTTGYNSFGYGNFDFTIYSSNSQQDGIAILNGAYLYHGSLRLRGNFVSGAAVTTAAVIRMAGSIPIGAKSGTQTRLNAMQLSIAVECNNAGGTNAPKTWVLDVVNYAYVSGCYGMLDYSFGNATFGTATIAAGQFVFNGLLGGDTALAVGGLSGVQGGTWRSLNIPTIYPLGAPFGAAAALPTAGADFFAITLAANATVLLNPPTYNGGATLGVPQKVTIIITQAAAGGPYTVTWPVNGAPTTSSPTIIWSGMYTPQMSTAPSAADIYMLETLDGATWYGQAIQASAATDAGEFMALTAAYTLTSTVSLQKLFNATTNGACTVGALTTYFFECNFDLSSMSTTSGGFSFGFGGTATLTSIKYTSYAQKSAAIATPATAQVVVGVAATATLLVTASLIATGSATIRGIIRINAGGTIIPQVSLGVAAAAVVGVNSSFRIWPAGGNTQTNVGNWS